MKMFLRGMMMTDENFTFTEKYDLLGCIQCGRCTGGCPVTARSGLNVRRFVYDAYFQEKLDELSRLAEVWDCTTCHTCAVRCPKGLKPLEVLLGLRSLIVGSGKVQPTVRDALESVFLEGNPWGKPRATRCDWMKDLDVKIAQPGQAVENLFFVCCTICYDPKVQVIARHLVRLLNRRGINYGFIGEQETCCGSEVLALGEDYLFEEIVENNTDFLNQFKAKRLVTLSPHCLTTFKSRYPGLKTPVIH
ncbi:MAG TPA: (Fe-S)-binding protein, partial [Firmicutes bacterium]|nr:(Fe-S)-binding protein [Bacillota bacterium]